MMWYGRESIKTIKWSLVDCKGSKSVLRLQRQDKLLDPLLYTDLTLLGQDNPSLSALSSFQVTLSLRLTDLHLGKLRPRLQQGKIGLVCQATKDPHHEIEPLA